MATPSCPHFGQCGGCLYQDIDYPDAQLDLKKKALHDLFGMDIEIVPSPKAYGYRNRMDFVCAFKKVGFRKRGQYKEVVDLSACHLLNERFQPLFLELKKIKLDENIDDFNYLNHKGFLRYMVFRLAAHTPDLMVSFVTTTPDEKILPLVRAAEKSASSVNWLIQNSLADLSYGPIHQSFNSGTITEKIDAYSYKIGPNTFFQNNAYLTSKLFGYVKEQVRGTLLDLFCGAGAISIFAAEAAEQVLAIEKEEESIRFALENAEMNKVSNVSFLCADVNEWIKQHQGAGEYKTLILDPPRAGLGGKTGKRIAKLGAERIIYVSCSPKSFKDDMTWLGTQYKLVSMMGFDMFPQTPHVELVAVLERME